MSEPYAFLPCNGLDKPEGPIARELALRLLAAAGGELVCPVLLARAPTRYAKALTELPLFVIDGCGTRCASHLASDRGLKVERKVQINEVAKTAGVTLEDTLGPGPTGIDLVRALVDDLLAQRPAPAQPTAAGYFSAPVDYATFTHDKFIFRVPKEGYFFNENDCWVRVSGKRARVGISDFMQQSLSGIVFCTPPGLGERIEQFGEAGTVESSKATFEVVSPVSGKVVAINYAAVDAPEVINQDPYESGWIAELELMDFGADRELLLDGKQYLELVKRKAAEFKV